jgi:hypothetical protein
MAGGQYTNSTDVPSGGPIHAVSSHEWAGRSSLASRESKLVLPIVHPDLADAPNTSQTLRQLAINATEQEEGNTALEDRDYCAAQ